jgi:hypothetical protein
MSKATAVKSPADSMKTGTKYLTLRRKKPLGELTLRNGVVVQTAPNLRDMQGWAPEKILDWADRCRVTVFVSAEAGKLGARIEGQPVVLPKV